MLAVARVLINVCELRASVWCYRSAPLSRAARTGYPLIEMTFDIGLIKW
jgi:hypothetical protein